MTYAELTALYDQLGNPGAQGLQKGTDEWNKAFNGWTDELSSLTGTEGGGWEAIPSNAGQAWAQAKTQGKPSGGAVASGFSGLLPPAIAPASVTTPSTGDLTGNYKQIQNANQGGVFSTVGSTDTEQNQVSGGTQTQSGNQQQQQTGVNTMTGNQASTGSTNQTGTQQQAGTQQQLGQTTGVSSTSAQDTLGFGALLRDQAGGVAGSDTANRAFLSDVRDTGGSAFGSQVDQAIRNATSGPGMLGVGNAATSRAAGFAAEEAGRNNMNQRLAAAQQLSGPTGLATLSTAANPYVGQTTAQTGSSNVTGVTNNTGTSSTAGTTAANTNSNQSSMSDLLSNTNTSSAGSQTGFSNLLGKVREGSAGVTSGASSQAGSGNIPASTQTSSGGCVCCTAAVELGFFRNLRVLRRCIEHKMVNNWDKYRLAGRGYFHFFTPIARWGLTHRRTARLLWPLAKAVVYEELRQSGRGVPFKLWPWTIHWSWHWFCVSIGTFAGCGYVKDPVILNLAKKYRILFQVKG